MKISRILNIFAVAVLFLIASSGAWAQSSDQAAQVPPSPHGGGPMFERMGPMGEGMAFVGFEAGLDGKTVAGGPVPGGFSSPTPHNRRGGEKKQRSATR